MRRRINLRQIEVFKAVIECGTVSAAAVALHVSQPALSKALGQLEAETELRLFDRVKGRLAPTEQGMQLYAEVDRIFSGVRQVDNAIEALQRQTRGRLRIGVMPALSGSFIQRVVTAFLALQPATYCSIDSRSSEWIVDSLVGRRLDVGFVSSRMQNPYVESELLMERPIVCVMPIGHALAARRVIQARDLANEPFVALDPETGSGQAVNAMFAAADISPRVVLTTNLARTLCEFVAAGTGLSLVHPLMVNASDRLVVRPFVPETTLGFALCHSRESRNARLIEDFCAVARRTAGKLLREALADRSPPVPSSRRRRTP